VKAYRTKSGEVRWRAVWEEPLPGDGRRQVKKEGFRSEAEAEAFLRKTLVSVDDGAYVTKSGLTLGEYLTERWLPSVRVGVEQSTWATWDNYVRGNVLPHPVALRPIQQLNPGDLDRHYALLLERGAKTGRGLAPKTVANVHGTIHAGLQHALERGVIRTNPATLASKPSKKSAPRPVWTPDELRAFWDVARDHRLYAALILAGTTGMRRGEICGLHWDSLDLDSGAIRVVHAMAQAGPERYLKSPKTHTGYRTIHVDEVTVAILRDHRRRQEHERALARDVWRGSGFVFTTELGEPLRPDRLTRVFEHLRAKTDLPRISLHDLRHTFATLALADGANLKALAEYLGHSETVLLSRYAHVVRGANEALGRRMGELVGPAREEDG
jgi:integrase